MSEGRDKTAVAPARRVTHYATPVDDEALEFIKAIEDFKVKKKQPFPTWTEVLGVLKSLGYQRAQDSIS
jgi:hypothetical protein